MDLSLRPATRRALSQYRSRYNSLLWRRGVLVALVVGLSLLSVIALLDRAWLVPEAARPWCSLLAYAACALAAWRLALALRHGARDQEQLARGAEAVAPEVREKLLAAVELAHGDAASVPDSPEFRARLQDEVASAVQGLNWTKRQPATPLLPWAKRLALLLVGLAGLSWVPLLHFGGFLARAALPFADLERPSSVRITVETPKAERTLAAIASEVDVAVRVEGEAAKVVQLEYGEVTASLRRLELTKVTGDRYEGRVPVAQTDVRFRVRALDGITAWHTLEARPRPAVVEFEKTIVPPAYTKLPEQKVKDNHGDLEALEGSVVKLAMKCNQPVSEASILLNPEMATHPAAPAVAAAEADGLLRTAIQIDGKTEAWTARLVGKETGFTNEQAAAWRITTLQDLPPVVTLTAPAETQLSVLADETVKFAGSASDDVGLAGVELERSLNGGTWETTKLSNSAGKEAAVEHSLGLAALQVQAGDTLQVKLLAIDTKGQKSESTVVRIVVLEQSVDPRRRVWAAEQRNLAQTADRLSELTRELAKDASGLNQTKKKDGELDADTKLARVKQELEQASSQADELWTQLKKTAQLAPTALDAEEVNQLGRRLAQLRQSALRKLKDQLQGETEAPETVKRLASEAAGAASTLREASRLFAADDTAELVRKMAQQSVRQQMQLKDQSLQANREPSQRSKWQEQQRGAIAAHETLNEELKALQTQVHGGFQNQIQQAQRQVNEAARDVEQALDQPNAPPPPAPPQTVTPHTKSPENLYGAADTLGQRLQRQADTVKVIADDAAKRAADMRQRLQQADNPALVALDQAQGDLAQSAAKAKNPPKREKPAKDGLADDERAQQRLTDAARQLQDQAELKEQNPLTNDSKALDANRTSRAADKLANELKQAEPAAARDKAIDLARIARTLEADTLATEAKKAIDEAAARNTVASTQRLNGEPEDAADAAQQAADQLKQLPQALRRTAQSNRDAPLQQLAKQAADQAKNAAQMLKDQARRQERSPTNNPEQPPPALAEAQTSATQVADALAEQAKAARDQLAALTPKVSEMMKQVAQNLDETKAKTQDAAKQAEAQQPVAEVAKEAKAIQPEAAKDAEHMAALQAALRHEANAAQLAEERERQLARTADVALEQMRQKSPQIAQNLKQATQATASQPQAEALNKAAQAQQATADALKQLAENFAKMEAGQPVSEQSLTELAQLEEKLGVKEPLDEAYKAAEELAKMAEAAKRDPEAALAALEAKLKQSPPMQSALAQLAEQTAKGAENALAEKANQPSFLGDAAEAAGHEAARVARHQARLQQEDAAKKTAEASEKLAATAKATKAEPGNATPETAKAAQAAAKAATESAESTVTKTPSTDRVPDLEMAEANSLAGALDQLDQALHPLGAPTQADPGQPKQQQSGQQQAQKSMANAQQNQQQSMAQARAEGKVPGQPPQQQTAQNQPAKEDPNGQQSKEGGNLSTIVKAADGTLVPIQVLVDGDWGKLPAKMAEDLSEATRQEAAPEYRAAIENYYKAISARAKK